MVSRIHRLNTQSYGRCLLSLNSLNSRSSCAVRYFPSCSPAALSSCINISAVMPSELESSMESLIMVFHRYADKDGDGNTLSKKELKELMQTELASFLKSQKDPATIDKIMKDLDQNGDGKVSFEEFVSLVVGLSIACEQIYQLHTMKSTAKK
ncbi:protein S100-A1 [Coregonus clupeaformis]|uniref:protein S100-A1 n=1 Tax=Coregonus clupeaformis TaxID=59861 RepID=UPI001BE12198|nr:protein S100-A1 [Coregonus clupeaformis]